MSEHLLKTARRGGYRLLLLQAIVALVIAVTLILLQQTRGAYSAALGGLICIIPNWYFIRKTFSYGNSGHGDRILRCFYRAEIVKYILTLLLFAITFKLFNVLALPLILTFIAMQLVTWCAPLMFKPYRGVKSQ